MEVAVYLVIIGLSFTGASNPDKTHCNLPEHPRNGYFMVERCDNPGSDLCKNVPETPAEFGTVIAFACHQGYQLQGLEVNYCSDGVWNPTPPTCEPAIGRDPGCKLPSQPTNGHFSIAGCEDTDSSSVCSETDSVGNGKVLTYTCNAGYQTQGYPIIVCNMSQWSSNPPSCSSVVEAATLSGDCRLPETPSHGSYRVRGCGPSRPPECSPANLVRSGTVLDYNCEPGYNISGDYLIVCANGKWVPDIPTCPSVKCKPLTSKTLDIACYDGTAQRRELLCNLPVPVGTHADLMCKVAYKELLKPGYRTIRCAAGGTWDYPLFQCTPICGKRTSKGQPLIANGEDAKISDFPWHVAIYSTSSGKEELIYICGGTVISPRLVLTAAHCVWNEQAGTASPADKYKVVAGKYYSDWNAKDEHEKQIRQVSNVHIPETFRGGIGRYASNIAVLVLNEDFILTWAVQPICVDWDNSEDRVQLRNGNIGSIVGWGITEDEKVSAVLKTANIPYVDYQTCWNAASESFRPFISVDGFCAGYRNGTALCAGDSGGGLAFEHAGTKLWYLRGILSVGERNDTGRCATHMYTVFTKVSQYIPWIKTYYSENI